MTYFVELAEAQFYCNKDAVIVINKDGAKIDIYIRDGQLCANTTEGEVTFECITVEGLLEQHNANKEEFDELEGPDEDNEELSEEEFDELQREYEYQMITAGDDFMIMAQNLEEDEIEALWIAATGVGARAY